MGRSHGNYRQAEGLVTEGMVGAGGEEQSVASLNLISVVALTSIIHAGNGPVVLTKNELLDRRPSAVRAS